MNDAREVPISREGRIPGATGQEQLPSFTKWQGSDPELPTIHKKAPDANGIRGFEYDQNQHSWFRKSLTNLEEVLGKSLAVASTHRRLPRPTKGRWGIHNEPEGFYGVVRLPGAGTARVLMMNAQAFYETTQ